MRVPKVYRPWIKVAREFGWTVDIASSGHVRWTAPDGRKMFSSGTATDFRGVKNCRAELRRRGLPI